MLSVLAALVAGTVLAVAPAATAGTTTTTTLASSANPSTVGQAVTLTATVVGDTPTGSVTFAEPAAGATLGVSPLTSGVATLVVDSFAAGDHALTATYSGDADDDSSDASLTQTVVAPAPPPPPPPVVVKPVDPPKVHLSVSKKKASVGDKVMLHWRSKRADSVMASGDWGGAQKAKGHKKVRITERGTHVFKLTVHNAAGDKTAKVEVVATRKAKELELVVTEELVLVGTDVDVSADGLAKGESYTIRLDGKPVLTGKANKKGDVARAFELAKTTKEGALSLTITGSNPDRVGAALLNVIRPKTLDVAVDLSELARKAEQTVTVSDLAAGESVTVTYAGKKLTTGKADDSGLFTFTFKVGNDTGEHTVKVTGAVPTRVGEATFTVLDPDNGGGGGGGGGAGTVGRTLARAVPV